jgi:L-aminopeptidase/D-esterase-like protein
VTSNHVVGSSNLSGRATRHYLDFSKPLPHNMNIQVSGIKIGHAHSRRALTGCTVILCEEGATCGIDRRGGGTTTRQADAFEPWHVVDRVYGVLLTGGSAFGLGALSGVLRFLEEKGIGFDMRVARVPIVAAAGLFDLGIGDGSRRPDPEMAFDACLRANEEAPAEGCVGAGMGATVGKILGLQQAMKSGIGWASRRIGPDLVVEAITAVNAGGDIVDPASGRIVAGVRAPATEVSMPSSTADQGTGKQNYFANALDVFELFATQEQLPDSGENTVIGVVLTNAALSKMQATKVAQMAQDGLARSVRPAHTMFDGDTIFTLATGEVAANVSMVGAFAAEVFAEAIVRGVRAATPLGGLPVASDVA